MAEILIEKEDFEKVKRRMLAEKISKTKNLNAEVSDDEVIEAIKNFDYGDSYSDATIFINSDETKKLIADSEAKLHMYSDLSGYIDFDGYDISFNRELKIVKSVKNVGKGVKEAIKRNLDIKVKVIEKGGGEEFDRKYREYRYKEGYYEIKQKYLNNEITLDEAKILFRKYERKKVKEHYDKLLKQEDEAIKMLEEMNMDKQAEIHKQHREFLEKEKKFRSQGYELLSLDDIKIYDKESIYKYDSYIDVEAIKKVYDFYNKYKDEITDIIVAYETSDPILYALIGERNSDRAVRVKIAEF